VARVRSSKIVGNKPALSAGQEKVPQMDSDKQKQEISLIGRLFSLEALLVIMGLLSLISGIITRDLLRLSFGIIILGGAALAVIFRRRRKALISEEKRNRRKDD
jgi:hypothetical protein